MSISTIYRYSRIRRGLYAYRAYNVKRFPKGWAIRDEDGNPWHSPCDTLRGVFRMIDTMYAHELMRQSREGAR